MEVLTFSYPYKEIEDLENNLATLNLREKVWVYLVNHLISRKLSTCILVSLRISWKLYRMRCFHQPLHLREKGLALVFSSANGTGVFKSAVIKWLCFHQPLYRRVLVSRNKWLCFHQPLYRRVLVSRNKMIVFSSANGTGVFQSAIIKWLCFHQPMVQACFSQP